MLGLNKPLSPLRARQHTFFLTAKPTIAVAGYPIINRVAHRAGNDFENYKQRPETTEPSRNFQRRVRASEDALAIHKHHSVKVFRGKTKFFQKGLTRLGLQCRELENAFRVVFQNPLHRGIAEIAHTVEE